MIESDSNPVFTNFEPLKSSELNPISQHSVTLDYRQQTSYINQEIEATKLSINQTQTTAALPDLVINNVSAPTSVAVGGSFNISYTLRNTGTGYSSYSYTNFYLSQDRILSSDDVYLDYDFNFSLNAGTFTSQSTTIYLDENLSAGNYYIIAVADAENNIRESNERNNIASNTTIRTTLADLVITNLTAPTTVEVGDSFDISYTLKNQGGAWASYSYTNFYLSQDTTLSTNDIYLDYSFNYSLNPRASSAESQTIYLNNSWGTGNYYLIAVADAEFNVAENRENNNTAVTPIRVEVDYSIQGYGLVNAAAAVSRALGQSSFPEVTDIGGNDWGADLVKAPEVWARGFTGRGITVAVVDTGVDRNHPDLRANIWRNTREIDGDRRDNDRNGYVDDVYGWNFANNNNNTLDDNSHGTHVAGTVAGVKNTIGVTGIAYHAKIMPVKVLAANGSGTEAGVARGIRYAADNGADVINLSLGGDIDNAQLRSAVQYATDKGSVVVMAAGNDGGDEPIFPARYATNWGLAVGAVDSDNDLAYFSNLAGSAPIAYVTAPGVNIYSTVPNRQYDSYDGTSMATPHVAGVVALLLSAKSNLTPTQVRSIITETSLYGTIGQQFT